MIGAVQLGIFAACVVLFVPMGMAGWHLSRNRLLFFSCALFITLAVSVHLTPYFPSFTDIVSSFSMGFENRNYCISLLHEIDWNIGEDSTRHSHGVDVLANSSNSMPSWNWSRSKSVVECGFSKLSRFDALDLLNGSWIVVAGDSEARLFFLSLIQLVLGSTTTVIEDGLFKRHADYQLIDEKHDLRFDFLWAPFVKNLTSALKKFETSHRYPDILVMGSGLWHMLHYTNSSDYGMWLGKIRESVISYLPYSPEFGSEGPVIGSVSVKSPHMFWLGMPTLINSMLNTEVKKQKMTDKLLEEYNGKVEKCRLLHQSGGPLTLLDFGSLTRHCGSRCTNDGMHYDRAVYEAAVQIMLNALLIQSQQRI